MPIIILAIFFVLPSFAQEVSDYWPKGQVPLETAHVKVLFAQDMPADTSLVTVDKVKLKDCVWDTRRVLNCKIAGSLEPDTTYNLIIGKERREFRTMSVFLADYRETLEDGKFRLKLTFSQPVATKGLTVALTCGKKPAQSYMGDLGKTGLFSLPVKAPANEVCSFSFPLGVKDLSGKLRSVPGEWLLRAGMPKASEEDLYYLALRGVSCGNRSFWDTAKAQADGISMPVLECALGDQVNLSMTEPKTKKLIVRPGAPAIKTDQWGNVLLEVPKTGLASFTVIARDEAKPHLTSGFIIKLRPQELLSGNYAELADEGAYFEGTKPFLTQLNHRSTPLVEISAKALSRPKDIIAAVQREEYYYNRRKPQDSMPEGKTFQLAIDGIEGFKSGIDLSRLEDFKAGIWWVQSEVKVPALSDPSSVAPGTAAERTSAAVLQFSDLGIHLKRGLRGSLVWVFRLSTGKPVSGAEVFISKAGEAVEVGETSKDGTLVIPEDQKVEANGVVIAQYKEHMVALPLTYMTQSGITNWDFGHSLADENDLNWQYDAIPSNPLYRPGEKGALKIYARKTGLMGPELSEHKDVPWTLTDPRGEKIAEGKVDFNKFGTAVVAFSLKPEAATGKYTLNVSGRYVMEPFSVEVFTTPTLKVTMDSLTKSKAPLSIAGTVEFHVGGGVQGSKGEAALVVRSRPYTPPSSSLYSAFEFYVRDASGASAELVGKNEFTTDKEGRFKASFDKVDLPEYGTLIAEATVTDGDGMSVSGRTDLTVSNRGWFPGTKHDDYVVDEGTPVKAQLIALSTEGEPVVGVKARYELKRRTWTTVRRLGSGNVYYYDSEMKEENAGTCEVVTATTPVTCPITPKGEGSYFLTVSTSFQGKQGPVREHYFWVPGPNSWAWGPRNNHDRIDVKPEKASYEFGEKARFIVQSPYKEGEALVTVERYGVIRHEVVKFSGGFWTYELPLEDSAYVPGVFVSVVLLKGRTGEKYEGGVDLGRPSFKMGYAQIQVSRQPTILKVEASTQARFSPGEEVEVSLNVKDWKGRKVDGEIAVTVVDDAVLQLVPSYKSFFEVLDTFYHIKGLGVWNYQTLTRLIGRRSFGKKGAAAGGGGGNGLEELRSNFKTVAHWEPALEVKDGKAKLKFKLPDNLTQWRVIAVAVDEKNRFGEGETTFKAVLPLMLTPFFPPFLRAGDSFSGAFGVQNATEEKLSAELSAKITGAMPATVEQTKDVAPGVRELLSFPFTTDKAGQLTLEARVKAKNYKDGVAISLPVQSDPGAAHVSGGLVPLTGTQALDFSMPTGAIAGSTRVRVYFTKSLLDGLDEAFKYVVGYPYGCWEQQTTGALFLTEYKEMEPWLAEFKFDAKKGDPRKAIQDYINKAPDYQRPDGSMGYYPGDYAGDPYLTVFTGHAFGVYKKAGFTIPKIVEEKLRARLLAMKDHAGDMGRFTDFKESMNANIAAILVDLNDPEGHKLASRIYPKRAKMDLFGQGQLLKALPAQGPEGKALVQELLKKSIARDSVVVFTEKIPESAKNWLYSERRGQCVVVDALLRHSMNPAIAAKMIQGLAPDKKTARWGNTQENYFCFQAFRTYARLFESTEKEATVAWTMGQDSRSLDVKRLQRPFVEYQEADLKVSAKARAELKSGGNAYLHTRMYWSTNSADATAAGNGFTLKKTALVKKGNTWVELKGKEWTVKKGDVVKVTLQVIGTQERYKVGLRDPIPAGWRALNPRLATTSVATQVAAGTDEPAEQPEYDWWDWETPVGFSASDMRLDSVQFFADRLVAAKSYQVEYLAQVTTVGEYLLPPTIVEEMYDEEWRANTVGVRVRVTE